MTKTVLITGASSGIGEAIALYLDKAGWKVFAGVRHVEDGLALQAKATRQLQPVLLDVTNPVLIKEAVAKIETGSEEGGLTALINNAGINHNGPLEFTSLEDFRQVLEVNLIGQLAVIQFCLPLLRRAKGRIINISSVSAMMAFPFGGAYGASKYALESLSKTLQIELIPWAIPVVIIEPSSISSKLTGKSIVALEKLLQTLPVEAGEYYGLYLQGIAKAMNQPQTANTSPEKVAEQVFKILMVKKPKSLYRVGKGVKLLQVLKLLPEKWKGRLLLRQLKKLAKAKK